MAQFFFKIRLTIEDLPSHMYFVWVNVVKTSRIKVILLGLCWLKDSLSGCVNHFLIGLTSRLLFLEKLLIGVLLDALLHRLVSLLLL
jgi:hypothetical protein